jgi:hypothetical protein
LPSSSARTTCKRGHPRTQSGTVQLANEQRNIGQQRRVRYSYDLLAARGGVSKGNIAKMLTSLEQAGVLRRQTQPDPERGGSISIAHLSSTSTALSP